MSWSAVPVKHILHLVPAEPFGGAQRLVIALAALQCRSGDTAEIVFTAANPGSAALALAAAKEAGASATAHCGSTWSQLRSLRRRISSPELSIVHFHVAPPWAVLAMPARPRAVLVSHLHTRPLLMVHPPTRRRRLEFALTRALMRRCDQLIAISQWTANAWRLADAQLSPSVVFNGIALPNLPPAPLPPTERPFTLGMASRLSDRKGVEEFLALAVAVHARAPDIRFVIAGHGPLRAQYEAEALRLGIAHVLRWEGFVEDMASFWSVLDLAAFTPPFEPFGLRLIEPIAYGVPVAAFRTDTGSDEVIERCRGVAAVPYGETAALAEIVICLRDLPDERHRMASDGFLDLHGHFSLEAMVDGIACVYANALALRAGRAG